jgi:hypothetical protein
MQTKPEIPRMSCPRCGNETQCGIGADQPCWCATELAPALPVPKAMDACYCRRCLTEVVAERRRVVQGD